MNQTMIILKLLDGTYQLTRLNLDVTSDGAVNQPLTLNAPVYNENRTCQAYFYKKNSRNIWFYEEMKPKNVDTMRFV